MALMRSWKQLLIHTTNLSVRVKCEFSSVHVVLGQSQICTVLYVIEAKQMSVDDDWRCFSCLVTIHCA